MLCSGYLQRKFRFTTNMKRYLSLFMAFAFGIWLSVWLFVTNSKCNNQIKYLKLNDNLNFDTNSMNLDSLINNHDYVYSYNKNLPILFVGGVPRSGTTLMRAMLDAHPLIRCGEETRLIPRIISMKQQWTKHEKESERLRNAGITDEIMDSAVTAFILEIIVKHGKPANQLCNKDPLILKYSGYVNKLFPNSKYILMIRDGRATLHSIITRKITITGFDLNSYRDCLIKWNYMIESMYSQCLMLGPSVCLPVYYEQLVLHPKNEMEKILKFMNIQWDDAVLNHEKFIGSEISVSKVERSTDQIVKPINLEALNSWIGHIPNDVIQDMDRIAPMLRKLGYDPYTSSPYYGNADLKVHENTNNIQENREYWINLARQYSNHMVHHLESN